MYTYTIHCTDGCSDTVKRVTVDSGLKYAPYSQAGWRVFKNGSYLVSFASLVFKATITDEGTRIIAPVDVAPCYSVTTSRHTTMALKQLGYNLKEIATIKKALNKGETIII